MQKIMLIRQRETANKTAVLGRIIMPNGIDSFHSLELPFKENKVNESSIPAGVYKCKVKWSKRLGRVFEVLDVSGRSDILIHVGNSYRDTTGCILVGKKVSDTENGLVSSRQALGEMLLDLPNSFELTVIDVWS